MWVKSEHRKLASRFGCSLRSLTDPWADPVVQVTERKTGRQCSVKNADLPRLFELWWEVKLPPATSSLENPPSRLLTAHEQLQTEKRSADD